MSLLPDHCDGGERVPTSATRLVLLLHDHVRDREGRSGPGHSGGGFPLASASSKEGGESSSGGDLQAARRAVEGEAGGDGGGTQAVHRATEGVSR